MIQIVSGHSVLRKCILDAEINYMLVKLAITLRIYVSYINGEMQAKGF